MKKIIFSLLVALSVVTSCEQHEPLSNKKTTKGIVITDINHDQQVKELLHNIAPSHKSGRASSINEVTEPSEIYKYFDLENDNISYSIALKDGSEAFFENLVITKIGNDFYAFILRYVYGENFVVGSEFEGTIQRFNLEGELIGERQIPDSGAGKVIPVNLARTKSLYSCVTGYNVECHSEYEVSTATGRPIPETLATICVNKAVYGWCGDNAGPMPSPWDNTGWGTYVPASGGGSLPSGSTLPDDPDKAGNAGGIVPNQKSNPVVIVPDLRDQRILNFKRGLNSADQQYLKKNAFIANAVYIYLEGTLDDSNPIAITEYPEEAKSFARELITLARLETNSELSSKVFSISVLSKQYGYQDGRQFDQTFFSTIDPYVDLDLKDTDVHDPLTIHLMVKYQILQTLHPEWSEAKVFWETVKDVVHMGLDLVGLVPVLGEGADLVNGAIYVLEGDGVNATLSFAAAVPVVGAGSTISKHVLKIISVDLVTKVRLVWKVTAEGITFGSNSWCRRQLRQALGMVTGDARQAHHIIPLNKQSHAAVQKAAQSKNAFHMNEALNGIPLNKDVVHSGSHPDYDRLVQQYLDSIPANATPDEAYNAITTLIDKIRTAIQKNPTTPVNQLRF